MRGLLHDELQLESNKDIKSFRLTCRQTSQALATEVLRRITVNVNKETFEKELCKLRYLAEGRLLTWGIRQVDIKLHLPDLDLKWPGVRHKRRGHVRRRGIEEIFV